MRVNEWRCARLQQRQAVPDVGERDLDLLQAAVVLHGKALAGVAHEVLLVQHPVLLLYGVVLQLLLESVITKV